MYRNRDYRSTCSLFVVRCSLFVVGCYSTCPSYEVQKNLSFPRRRESTSVFVPWFPGSPWEPQSARLCLVSSKSSRGAGEQGCRGAGAQGCRGARNNQPPTINNQQTTTNHQQTTNNKKKGRVSLATLPNHQGASTYHNISLLGRGVKPFI